MINDQFSINFQLPNFQTLIHWKLIIDCKLKIVNWKFRNEHFHSGRTPLSYRIIRGHEHSRGDFVHKFAHHHRFAYTEKKDKSCPPGLSKHCWIDSGSPFKFGGLRYAGQKAVKEIFGGHGYIEFDADHIGDIFIAILEAINFMKDQKEQADDLADLSDD